MTKNEKQEEVAVQEPVKVVAAPVKESTNC